MTREEKEQWDIFMRIWVIPALKNTWNEKKCKEIVEALEEWEEQEPKTGHWVEHPEIETSTPEYLMFYECSECGDKQCFCKSDIHKKRFCGNCGCRMVEPQERSEVMG